MATMALREEFEVLTGHNLNLCFQCGKCSAGCPMADKMDLKPAQIMHRARLGRAEDLVLRSQAIWLCLGCETCSARCPQQVDPAAVMNAARILALHRHKPAVKEVGTYYRGFVDNMRLNGKIHDASVVALTRLRTGTMFADLPLAWQLAKRRRVKLPPLPIHGAGFRRLYQRAMAVDRGAHSVPAARATSSGNARP
jgi:heterodisulfide reductase subunit C